MRILYLTLSLLFFASCPTQAMKRSLSDAQQNVQINSQSNLLALPDDILTIIITDCDIDGKYALLSTCRHIQDIALKNLDDDEKTAHVTRCINKDNANLLRILFAHGADPNKATLKTSPLWLAASKNSIQCAQFLIEETDIDINQTIKGGSFPLYVAAQKGHSEIIQLLLRHKNFDIKKKYNSRYTSLYAAAECGHLASVKLLLEHDITLLDIPGKDLTPLHIASINGHTDVVSYLLTYPTVDTNPSCNRFSPLHSAVLSGRAAIVALFINHDATLVNISGHDENTPLHFACLRQDIQTIKELLKSPYTNINAKNKAGDTPLDIAIERKNIPFILLLARNGGMCKQDIIL